MSADLVERLLQDAAGLEQWDAYELGQAVPPALSYLGIAERIRTLTASLAQVTADLESTRAVYENLEASEVLNGYKNRATAAEADNAKLREEVERALRSLFYPVDTSILAQGYDVRHDEGTVTFAVGILIRALTTGATK